jgi:hypothetical protein
MPAPRPTGGVPQVVRALPVRHSAVLPWRVEVLARAAPRPGRVVAGLHGRRRARLGQTPGTAPLLRRGVLQARHQEGDGRIRATGGRRRDATRVPAAGSSSFPGEVRRHPSAPVRDDSAEQRCGLPPGRRRRVGRTVAVAAGGSSSTGRGVGWNMFWKALEAMTGPCGVRGRVAAPPRRRALRVGLAVPASGEGTRRILPAVDRGPRSRTVRGY